MRQSIFSKLALQLRQLILKCACGRILAKQPLCEKLESFAVRTVSGISYFLFSYQRWHFNHSHTDLLGMQKTEVDLASLTSLHKAPIEKKSRVFSTFSPYHSFPLSGMFLVL